MRTTSVLPQNLRHKLIEDWSEKLAWTNSDDVDAFFKNLVSSGAEEHDLLLFSIVLKESGYFDYAKSAINSLCALYPESSTIRYEQAVLELQFCLGNAVDMLIRCLHFDGGHDAAMRLLIALSAYNFLVSDRVTPSLSENERYEENYRSIGSFLELIAFTKSNNDFGLEQPLFPEQLVPKTWNSPEVLLERLHAAIKTKQPFSVIRLGDGEGIMFCMSSKEEYCLKRQYLDARQYFSRRWFGDNSDLTSSYYYDHQYSLRTQLADTDVVGLPTSHWLVTAFTQYDERAFLGCMNAIRVYNNLPVKMSGEVCDTSIMHKIIKNKYFADLLKAASRIVLVSWNPMASNFLHSLVPGLIIHSIFINPTQSDINVLNLELGPPSSASIIATKAEIELLPDAPGSIALIAAGFSGKLFSAAFRAKGYVAVDIGSALDLEMGLKIR